MVLDVSGAGCLRVLDVSGARCPGVLDVRVLDVPGARCPRVLDVWVLDVPVLDVPVLDVREPSLQCLVSIFNAGCLFQIDRSCLLGQWVHSE